MLAENRIACEGSLGNQIVRRRPRDSDGNSGSKIESVTLRDGRNLLVKRVSPESDWMARETHDEGRLSAMWASGLLARVPEVIDHTIVAVERDGNAWNVFMRDVSDALIPHNARLGRAGVRRILSAARELHEAFWAESLPELCTLEDRYSLFSPATGRRERARGSRHGIVFTAGWDAFFERAPADIAQAVAAILERPRLLAEQLERCEQTLIHGDLRLGNLGFSDGRVVMIDWGERVGIAPPAAERGTLRSPRPSRRPETSRVGERCDETSLQLSLIGSLAQLGGLLGFWLMQERSDEGRAVWIDELAWWMTTGERALNVWSPV
ncbi:MAG: phosphotransferase [Actinomycetota bacterium]|nr:phosphotransferase [Actinomycetota bacterium]